MLGSQAIWSMAHCAADLAEFVVLGGALETGSYLLAC
jgi:hypothetical protein